MPGRAKKALDAARISYQEIPAEQYELPNKAGSAWQLTVLNHDASAVAKAQIEFDLDALSKLRAGFSTGSQRTGFVRQLVLFRRDFLVRDPGCVQSFLGAPGIFDDELDRAGRALGRSQETQNIHLGVPQRFRDAGDCSG